VSPIVPTATFGTGANAGYFFAGSRTIPGVPQGSQAYFQVRVWRASDGPTWAVASTTIGAQLGGERVFSPNGAVLGPYLSPPLGGGVTPPPNLLGLQSFSLSPPIPEPSTIPLCVLGVAGLLVLRRRK
jgi:hypothetical protein